MDSDQEIQTRRELEKEETAVEKELASLGLNFDSGDQVQKAVTDLCKNCKFCQRKTDYNDEGLKHIKDLLKDLGLKKEYTSCRFTNVVYLLFCSCGFSYIGSTIRELRERLSEHLRRPDTLRRHSETCSKDWKWIILETLPTKAEEIELRLAESNWIDKINPTANNLGDPSFSKSRF